MKKNIQTRLYDPEIPGSGNCFAAAISCIMDLDSAEDVLQIQDYFHIEPEWVDIFQQWLNERGYVWRILQGHLFDIEGFYYLVGGKTVRTGILENSHVCIYQNGTMVHDPHPANSGLISEEQFYSIEKLK